VGFALTTLQRRLASSPEAIHQSLRRRRERLEKRLREEKLLKRGAEAIYADDMSMPDLSEEDIEELQDAPEAEVEQIEEQVVEQASAARTIAELEAEIATLTRLEELARQLRASGVDKKWEELSNLLQGNDEMFDDHGHRRKLIIFTEHRDTLNYLNDRIKSLLGKQEAVVNIHGGMGREDRRKVQESFTQDKEVEILVATDAAGEGINLQRAHLMVNYDLPWNPNRLEQRFGRIHRIGQTEVCHMWSLVAEETREGDVFLRLLKKLEVERQALGGGVFDVLGTVFQGTELRKLLIEAIRYGDKEEVRARLSQILDQALDREHLRKLLEERALASDQMAPTRVKEIREQMERAEARRLQPHFIRSFFLEAFRRLGGTIREREKGRYEITHVPAVIRTRDRLIGMGEPLLTRYERITFEKELISVPGQPLAAFVCPGHPLLDATIDLILERYHNILKKGALLVDESDESLDPRLLFYLEHSIQDGRLNRDGSRRVVSRQLQFVEIRQDGQATTAGYAPYLDYRPIEEDERNLLSSVLEADWLSGDLESGVLGHAIMHIVPRHLEEVRRLKEELVGKTMAAVKDRLTKEIAYWDHRANELKAQELAGKSNAKINSGKARQRADDLEARLRKRLEELESERRLAPMPPVVIGGALVVPGGLLKTLHGERKEKPDTFARETARVARLAMAKVMELEAALGRTPRDVSQEKCGYDIESLDPKSGRLFFLEVKGRAKDAKTVTISKNEILTGLNKPEEFILAIVEVDGDTALEPAYVKRPFGKEPDFGVTSVNYDLARLLDRALAPS
jgi:superfamily II DNA or RNA helicase